MPSNSRTGGERSNAERAPHQIDVHVGAQIRLRRTLLGITQGRLAELIGLTFQQIQKYEGGANRIGASRLFEIGAALDVPVSFFFQGLESQSEEQAAKCDGGPIDAKSPSGDFMKDCRVF
jgi:transcriptional regulator with XRE-family HTH domain